MQSPSSVAVGLLCVAGLVAAAPPPSPGQPPEVMTCHGHASAGRSTDLASAAPSSPSSRPGPPYCASGGRCDCSRIRDRNSDEYFQCVTDPSCERCWVSARASTTASRSGSKATTNYRTVAPGTYTVTASHVVSVIVVPAPPERTPEPATPSATSSWPSTTSASPRVVTVVETTVVTIGATPVPTTPGEPAPTPVSSADDAAATAALDEAKCADICDCARVRDKKSPEYYQCLTNPVCEDCRDSAPSSPPKDQSASTGASGAAAEPASARPTTPPGSSDNASTASSPARPSPTCPPHCDCSKIKDKQSDE